MAQQLFSAGLALSIIWEKGRGRDGQREVAGDKGQWGFVLQGMRPAAEARARGGQREVVGDKKSGLCSTRGDTSCGSSCRMVARGSSYQE
jgi:hypothetical protein